MSDPEIGPTVIGAVKALIAAYKNAGCIVQNIKEQRMARGALPPSDALEESLQDGHWEIDKITAQGIQRFGSSFEQGDDTAYRAIQALTIEIQASFLTLACGDDNAINFEACIDSAIGARLRAVNILNELYLRQQKRSTPSSDLSVVVSPISPTARPLPTLPRPSSDEMKEVVEAPAPNGPKKRSGTLDSKSSGRPESERSSGSIRLSRKSSWGVFKILHRTSSADQTTENTSNPSPQHPRPPYITSPQTTRPSSYVTSPSLSPQSMPMMSASHGLTSAAPPSQIITPPISPISIISSIDTLTAAGFCKGAYHVQQGTLGRGLQLSAKNMEWTCHCRKCPFAIPADHERGRPCFDDKAHSTSKFRWRSLLLFKAHLASSQKKKRIYKCLICVLMGHSSTTYDGEHDLFEHMFSHQGGVLNGLELWGPLCLELSGPRIGTETTFDICFAENPRFALPESAFEMSIATEVFEADGTEIFR